MKRLLLIAAVMAMACVGTASAFLFQFNLNNFCGQSRPCVQIEKFGVLSSARTLAFGTHSTGTTTRRTITLYNTGTAAINDLAQGVYSSAIFSAATSATNPCGAVLAAKSNCNMDVRFTPAAAQAYSATAVVLSNQLENYMFTVVGTGNGSVSPPTTPVITVTPGDSQNTIALDSGGIGADSYALKWGTVSGSRTNTIDPVTLPYNHTGLTNGTPYYYSLLAINGGGSTESAEVSGTPAASSGDTAPTGAIAFWPADSETLSLYNATDGSTVLIGGNPTTVPGTATYVAGHSGNGIQLTDGNTVPGIAATAGNTLNVSNGWVELWYQKTATVASTATMWTNDFGYDYLGLQFTNGDYTTPSLYYNGNTYSFTNTTNVFDGNWHKIRVNWVANGTATLTIDGTQTTTSMSASGIITGSNIHYINLGARLDNSRPAYGIIDSVAIGQ